MFVFMFSYQFPIRFHYDDFCIVCVFFLPNFHFPVRLFFLCCVTFFILIYVSFYLILWYYYYGHVICFSFHI